MSKHWCDWCVKFLTEKPIKYGRATWSIIKLFFRGTRIFIHNETGSLQPILQRQTWNKTEVYRTTFPAWTKSFKTGLTASPEAHITPKQAVRGSFSFLYLKKTKFQKYMSNREIFKNGCLSPPNGRQGVVAHPVGDRT